MERETKVNKECQIGIGRTKLMLAHPTAQMGVELSFHTSLLAIFRDTVPSPFTLNPAGMAAATVAFEMVQR